MTCKQCNLKSFAAQKLNDIELDVMGVNCAEVTFESGDIIIKQDTLSTNVAYIKSGLVKIHLRGPIKEQIMKISRAPAYLCLPSNFGDKVHHFSVTALEKTTVCFIDVTIFKNFIYQNGEFAYQIILDLSKDELLNFHNNINNIQKQNIARISDAILFFSKEVYQNDTFILPISRQDFGDFTGISREGISRILTDFHNEKIIKIDGRNITILNHKMLMQISEKG